MLGKEFRHFQSTIMPSIFTPDVPTVADLVNQLGGVPLKRIRMKPFPGTATERDLLRLLDGPNKCLCELIDGTLVEKVMGSVEAHLALRLGRFLEQFLEDHDLGVAYGSDGPFRILAKQVRMPDVSVFRWESLPDKEMPNKPVPALAPDLAIEVFSAGNTKKEMQRKLRDYFKAGVKAVWIIYPKNRTAEVYASPKDKLIEPTGALRGGDLLPGFELPLAKLFERMEKGGKRKKN
jgi:Uma2 family endonuclease